MTKKDDPYIKLFTFYVDQDCCLKFCQC